MRLACQKGLTLVELIITVSIMAIIVSAAIPLLSSSLDAHNNGMARSRLYHEGMLAMETMTHRVRCCTFLLIPNAHSTTRDILAVSGFINDDNDYYFDDPLFPRIDEDVDVDMTSDGMHGIAGYDDDGDGDIDKWSSWWGAGDDDEDAWDVSGVDEDPLDGKDNDGDGNIDEDCWWDFNADGWPGVQGMDDDGDGQVDEGHQGDDDEDGSLAEVGLIPEIYYWNTGTSELMKYVPYLNDTQPMATHVTDFEVIYEAPERIRIKLELTGDDGETVGFVEYVHPRNTYQRTGKRVR